MQAFERGFRNQIGEESLWKKPYIHQRGTHYPAVRYAWDSLTTP